MLASGLCTSQTEHANFHIDLVLLKVLVSGISAHHQPSPTVPLNSQRTIAVTKLCIDEEATH